MNHKWILVLVVAATFVVCPVPGTVYAAGCDGANIIFSELDYDQPGTDSAEFIELRILNATTISSCELRFINGDSGGSPAQYNSAVNLAGTYAANKYLVIGSTGVGSSDLTIKLGGGSDCNTDCIQQGPRDGFALVDTSGSGTVVWLYSYEGQITNYNPGDGSSNSSTDLGVSENNNTPNYSIHNGTSPGVGDCYTSTTVNPGNPGPTTITLHALDARVVPFSPLVVALPALGLVAAGGVVAYRRRKA